MTKGTLSANNVALTDTIGTPTTSDYRTDTSNSGVYTYDAGAFGTSSDASNSYPIYFYRGILENNPGTYGAAGLAVTYPNYVKLITYVGDNYYNTCWRIVRTTGSGGVKMIYNGIFANGTCANDSPSIGSYFYNRGTSFMDAPVGQCTNPGTQFCGILGYAVYVGYSYNSTYTSSNYTTAINNSTLFSNNVSSVIKTNIETWFSDTISNNNVFESSAGYCNDRSTPSTNEGGSATMTVPYLTGGSATTIFGGYNRIVNNSTVSLSCPNTNGKDLLSNGNGLGKPVALLTADEAVLAGNGLSGKEAYDAKSYLNTSSTQWLLSPYRREMGGTMRSFQIRNTGTLGDYTVSFPYDVRPVVSLKHNAMIMSGSGTATDPWTVSAP